MDGISAGDPLAVNGSETREDLGDDSEVDENDEIFELECRDFDNEDGIESDL